MLVPLPFSVSCSLPEPLLFECNDGRFQLIDHTPVSPLMSGHAYLLVEQPLAEFLRLEEVEGVAQEPAILFNPATREEIHSHVRVRVSQTFREDQICDLNLSGKRMLALNDQYYFASPELADALREGPFSYLTFSEGLSGFAADAA